VAAELIGIEVGAPGRWGVIDEEPLKQQQHVRQPPARREGLSVAA
jgi:hypothetical protein